MMEYRFNVTGSERKRLAGAISEIRNVPVKYLGAPTFGYEVVGYEIDQAGTVSGEDDADLLAALAERGFEAEQGLEQDADDDAVATVESVDAAPEEPTAAPDRLTIEMPLDGFTPESLETLTKLIASKAPLIMAALGAEELPLGQPADTLRFPWFRFCEGNELNAYAQFIAALCKTAREKKRVVAKRREAYENPRFTMRVWLIGLGMIGEEYKQARKLLLASLEGDRAWRYGKPVKEVAENV